MLLWFAFGKYGSVRFGGQDAEPEFRTLSWIAMLFCAGIGTSLLYWATIEWVYYYQAPPFGIEAESAEAADWAAMYGLFHWGPMAWALYCIPALPIAYAFHNRKIPFLRISQACRGVIGDRADGPLGKLIDVLFIFGLVGGTGTSLGLGTPILSESISTLTGIERTFALDAFVIVIWTAIFGTTVYLGMEKGIKRLADANVYLGFFLLAFVLVFGPTVFILDTFTNSLGLLATNFLKMSFYTDPVGASGFPQTWTVFYWAWWIAYAPFMGLFVARISRGRTIRQVVAANLVWGSLGCWLFFATFGNTALARRAQRNCAGHQHHERGLTAGGHRGCGQRPAHGDIRLGSCLWRWPLSTLRPRSRPRHTRSPRWPPRRWWRVSRSPCGGTGSSGRLRSVGWRWH